MTPISWGYQVLWGLTTIKYVKKKSHLLYLELYGTLLWKSSYLFHHWGQSFVLFHCQGDCSGKTEKGFIEIKQVETCPDFILPLESYQCNRGSLSKAVAFNLDMNHNFQPPMRFVLKWKENFAILLMHLNQQTLHSATLACLLLEYNSLLWVPKVCIN